MRSLLLVLLCTLCSFTLAAAKPNIILIYTDDHGHADLGIHGVVSDIKTPHLDALARSGLVATHGYSTAPQCVPSRGGLMTGRFQGRFDLDNNGSALDGFNKQTTIATRLQNAGYTTAQFGKWHLGPTDAITKHGFKHVFSQNAQRPFSANITLDGRDRPMSDLPPGEYHLDGCSKAAAAIIERYKDQPFFLYLAYRGPHTPLDAPKRYMDRFPGDMPERRRAALAMLSAIDDGVGLITSTLKKYDLTEKTLIFFIGDNGAPLKIHKVDSPLKGDPGGWDGSLNTPLNGEKGMLAEGGMSTPFLIAWPGTIPGGQVYEHPVSALDVAATAASITNLPVKPGDLDGVNILPYLTGENKTPPHDALYWRWMAQSAIREGKWKLLRGGEREYLYDLTTDREEKHNLAVKHPEVATRLRTKLKTWADGLTPPGMALGPMAATWNDYFDHYLEGKTISPRIKPPAANASETQGWEARNGKLTTNNGLIILTPEKADKPTFITKSKLKLSGPVTAQLTLKTAATGQGAIAWRLEGDKDFFPANRLAFPLQSTSDWQTHTLEIPTSGQVIHVRVHLPAGGAEFRSLDFKSIHR
ncbi:sulfatase family protein [Brevifollis gellanilyticus]|uniref:Aryl-sulfate sulfohydrolase n=1 Tax=Brevifollis gellanilyticus TaxID=748831 RepID=A0A512M6T4_9BACT|nr:sulfatase-like hydrolase/transferase [Brevifollis gellanilyticus]GEP42445.1 aryl-sulfate sulfohydrolase [Brevifollis gellanilyticus]